MDINCIEDDDEEFYQLVSVMARAIQMYYTKYIHKEPCMTSIQTGNMWLREILQGNERRCMNMFRMEKHVFLSLCKDLEIKYGLKGSRRLGITELVGMFVHILGHGCGNRLAQERFQHSGETISRNFSHVLEKVCVMALDIIKPLDLDFKEIPEQIRTDSRYMPHFKDCIGAIDGVHVPASISPEDQIPYIGRKGSPTQNVMAACNFDMQFTFAYAGWQGTAHDTWIFNCALRNPTLNFPKPPEGKYYLVDSGYPLMKGYLGPYKGERYHLPDFHRGSQPTGYQEVFNNAHSSLKSVIERTFGVWKKKWKILKDMPNYPYRKQVMIVVATMALHNYIRRHSRHDRHFKKFDDNPTYVPEEAIGDEENSEEAYNINSGDGANEIEILRNNIAASLMAR